MKWPTTLRSRKRSSPLMTEELKERHWLLQQKEYSFTDFSWKELHGVRASRNLKNLSQRFFSRHSQFWWFQLWVLLHQLTVLQDREILRWILMLWQRLTTIAQFTSIQRETISISFSDVIWRQREIRQVSMPTRAWLHQWNGNSAVFVSFARKTDIFLLYF